MVLAAIALGGCSTSVGRAERDSAERVGAGDGTTNGADADASVGADTPGADDSGNTDEMEHAAGSGSTDQPDSGAAVPDGAGDGDSGTNSSDEGGDRSGSGSEDGGFIEGDDPAETEDSSEPVACDAESAAIERRFLALVNIVRAEARHCGTEFFPAATPVGWDDRLEAAAERHSNDMATHNFFSHTGSDGSSVAMRVDAADYAWSAVGENIAAGQRNVREAVDGWVTSPGHCRNLMNPAFESVALTCSRDEASDYRDYWTNVLARPR